MDPYHTGGKSFLMSVNASSMESQRSCLKREIEWELKAPFKNSWTIKGDSEENLLCVNIHTQT